MPTTSSPSSSLQTSFTRTCINSNPNSVAVPPTDPSVSTATATDTEDNDTAATTPPTDTDRQPIIPPHTALDDFHALSLPWSWSEFHRHFLVRHLNFCRSCRTDRAHISRKQFRRTRADLEVQSESEGVKSPVIEGEVWSKEKKRRRESMFVVLAAGRIGEVTTSHCLVCGRGALISLV